MPETAGFREEAKRVTNKPSSNHPFFRGRIKVVWVDPLVAKDRDIPTEPMIAGRLQEISVEDFQTLSEDVSPAQAPSAKCSRRVLFVVHGVNNSFETAVLKAAVWSSNISYACPVVLYSWTSRLWGWQSIGFWRYLHDQTQMLRSHVFIRKALEEIASPSANPPTIDVFAHSLGAEGVVVALESADLSRAKLGRIVFAAADVEPRLFTQSALPRLRDAQRALLYVAKGDRPLQLSEHLRNVPRLGSVVNHYGEPVETVEVSGSFPDWYKHGYPWDSTDVIHDTREFISERRDASSRSRVFSRPPNWRLVQRRPVPQRYKHNSATISPVMEQKSSLLKRLGVYK